MLKDVVAKKFNELLEISKRDNYGSERFNYNGKIYSMGVSWRDSHVNVWADNGMTALDTVDFEKSDKGSIKDVDTLIKAICTLINNSDKGYIKCSECGELISSKELAGRCFAGVYCKNCWDTKWKAIESNMSYD